MRSGAASSVVEHLTFNQRALGSIPRRPTILRSLMQAKDASQHTHHYSIVSYSEDG
jgi:hypothetical protein